MPSPATQATIKVTDGTATSWPNLVSPPRCCQAKRPGDPRGFIASSHLGQRLRWGILQDFCCSWCHNVVAKDVCEFCQNQKKWFESAFESGEWHVEHLLLPDFVSTWAQEFFACVDCEGRLNLVEVSLLSNIADICWYKIYNDIMRYRYVYV